MTTDNIVTAILALAGGAIGKAAIDWLRFRKKDGADVQKTLHDSQTSALQVSSALLATWITNAGTAEEKLREYRQLLSDKEATIAEKTIALNEALHATNLCKEALERCKNGCE